jgi:hypothetical protein
MKKLIVRMLVVLVWAALLDLGLSEYAKYRKSMAPKPADIEAPVAGFRVAVMFDQNVKNEPIFKEQLKAAMDDLTKAFAEETAIALDHARRNGRNDLIKALEQRVRGMRESEDFMRRLMTPKEMPTPKIGKGNHH